MDEKKDINDLVTAGFPHECAVLLRSKTSSFGDKRGYWYTTRTLSSMPEDHLGAVFDEKHLGYKLYVKAFQNNKTFLRCEGGSPKQQLVSLGLSDATASIMADNFCIDGTSFCWLEQAHLEEIFPTRNYWGLLTEAQMQLKLVKEKMKLEKETSEMSLPRSDDTTGTSAGSSAAVALPQILPTSGSSAPDNSLPENKEVSLPTQQFDEQGRMMSRRHLRSNKTTTHAESSQDGLIPEEKVKTEVDICIGDFNAAPTVYKCCISHCGYHSAQQYCADVSLFSFPKAPLAAIEWLEFAERCNNGPSSTSVCKETDLICSRHFLENSLTRRRNVVQLKSQFGPFFPKADEMDDKTLEDQTDPSTQSVRERPRKRKTQKQERSRKSGAIGVIVDAKPRVETFNKAKKQERMQKVEVVADATLRIARRKKGEKLSEKVSGAKRKPRLVAAMSHQNSNREETAVEVPSAGLVKRRRTEKTLPNSNREETAVEVPSAGLVKRRRTEKTLPQSNRGTNAVEVPSARRGKRKPPFDPNLLKHLIEAVGGDANSPIPAVVSRATKMDVDEVFSPDSPDAAKKSLKLEAPVNKRAVAVVRPNRASASVPPVTATNPVTAKLLKSPQTSAKRNTLPEPMEGALNRAQAVYKNMISMKNKVSQATEFEVVVRTVKPKKLRLHKYFANSANFVKDYFEGVFPDVPEFLSPSRNSIEEEDDGSENT